MFDRLILVALTPITLASGAVGWSWSTLEADLDMRVDSSKPAAAPEALAAPPAVAPIIRSPDGLFRASVVIEGRSVPMIIDTGATRSVLSSHVAKRLELAIDSRGSGSLATINGTTRYRLAAVDTLRIGQRSLHDMKLIVPDGPTRVSLLGQDVLQRLGPIRIDADRLTFE
ncbi:MAG: retropepsin-like aspartic protease [Sphingopyxis sp.]|uniref:retropepsin-like aspartic protease family protein n=1 Tax=Sphingopyxis sp. TaxID=1908224 RepID=UPI002AB9D9B1|nr:retropepsin-like aspartic protease [Sphingopyxis sp.]MDZ3833695.1 retropepsin-like aspartic protease [Sphingopyxis sp.]